ncbi:MAG: tetratricopeptide repeat protein [Magnetococcales bacterium]|nr:tetratricopeptide repeat protein [Magnetococcales bacterium]
MNQNRPDSPPEQTQTTVDEAYSQALEYFSSANYTKADQICTSIIHVFPNHIYAINLLGLIAQQYNRHDLAVEQFQRAININGNLALLYYNLGTSLYPLGRLDEVVEAQTKAIAIQPDYAEAYSSLGNTLIIQGMLDRAVECLQKAIAINPGFADAHSNLGNALLEQGKYEEAVDSYNRAIAINPNYAAAYYNIGNIKLEQNRLQEAVNNYQKAIAIKADYVEALLNLGVVLKKQDNLKEAASIFQKAIAIKPDFAEAYANLGLTLKEQGKLTEAIAILQKAIAFKPDYAQAHCNLGVILKDNNKLNEATLSFQKAIAINPSFAQAYLNLGITQKEQYKFKEAVSNIQKAVSINPNDAEALTTLGATLQESGELKEAISCFLKAIAIDPNNATAYYDIGNIKLEQNRLNEAISNFNKALLIKPDYEKALLNCGVALKKQNKLEEAASSFQQAIAIKPDYEIAYSNLGVTLQELGKLKEAVANIKQAISLKPDYAQAYTNLGFALQEQGNIKAAVKQYKTALAIDPNYSEAYSNLLFLISYYRFYPPSEILKYHQQWWEVHSKVKQNEQFKHLLNDNKNKILRVGYISPDFRKHPVGNFMKGIIKNHNRSKIEVFCYSDVAFPDDVTSKFKSLADVWLNTVGFSDRELAQQIYDDKIDILLDLTGHTKENRLDVFAYKPAPIQVTYLGYCTTTGLQTMDYWLTDSVLTPKDSHEKSVEEIIRLPHCWACYEPSNKSQNIQLEQRVNNEIIFGSFNHLTKISDTVTKLWSRILKAVPFSKLYLKTGNLSSSCEQQRIIQLFAQFGIDKNRLILKASSNALSYLKEYGFIDIALDPFPRTGGATTADALWMGVPVITLSGNSMIERQGASLLTVVGRGEWIASTPDEYFNKAVNLAKKGVRSTEHRLELHNCVVGSYLCDGPGFTKELELVYQQMWQSTINNKNSQKGSVDC